MQPLGPGKLVGTEHQLKILPSTWQPPVHGPKLSTSSLRWREHRSCLAPLLALCTCKMDLKNTSSLPSSKLETSWQSWGSDHATNRKAIKAPKSPGTVEMEMQTTQKLCPGAGDADSPRPCAWQDPRVDPPGTRKPWELQHESMQGSGSLGALGMGQTPEGLGQAPRTGGSGA